MSAHVILNREEIARILDRLASQIYERHGSCATLQLVGIQRRGVDIARRLAALLARRIGRELPLGTLDINLYRDDWTSLAGKPQLGQSRIPAPVDAADILLVDDVLTTGATLISCGETILRTVPDCRLSIATLAVARGELRSGMEY